MQEFGLNFHPIKRLSCYNQVTLAKALLAIPNIGCRILLLTSARNSDTKDPGCWLGGCEGRREGAALGHKGVRESSDSKH